MSDDDWAHLRFLHRVDRVTTVLAVLAAAVCAAMAVLTGATGDTAEATVWLAVMATSTAAACWRPPLITIRETEET